MTAKPDIEKLKTCIQCGTCSATCPAAGSNPITHRHLWQLILRNESSEALNYWNCTNCALCEERCPRGIPLSSIIMDLREKEGTPDNMSAVTEILAKTRNINGDPAENRLLWTENMSDGKEEILSAIKKERAEVLYFTGCVSSLFPQAYKIPQGLSRLLIKGGVDLGFFGTVEWCCGYPLYGAGLGEEALKEYAEHTYEILRQKGANTIVFSCPTCLYVFAHLYPNNEDVRLVHYTEYLQELDLKFSDNDEIVTYHDPCDLGRKNGITEPPRELIKLTGASIAEMRFNRKEGKCCGGGGNLEMMNADLTSDIAAARVEEAMQTGASCLVTTCQQCKRTLQGGVRKLRSRIKVYDLVEFLAERLI